MTFSRTIHSVSVDFLGYFGTHGKAPRGNGAWAFYFGRESRETEMRWYRGTFAECARKAAADANAAGLTFITVAS